MIKKLILSEDVDDELEGEEEEVFDERTEGRAEEIVTEGLRSIVTSTIQAIWGIIDQLNGNIGVIKDMKSEDSEIFSVLDEMLKDEYYHIGQLEKLLQGYDDNSELIDAKEEIGESYSYLKEDNGSNAWYGFPENREDSGTNNKQVPTYDETPLSWYGETENKKDPGTIAGRVGNYLQRNNLKVGLISQDSSDAKKLFIYVPKEEYDKKSKLYDTALGNLKYKLKSKTEKDFSDYNGGLEYELVYEKTDKVVNNADSEEVIKKSKALRHKIVTELLLKAYLGSDTDNKLKQLKAFCKDQYESGNLTKKDYEYLLNNKFSSYNSFSNDLFDDTAD